MKLKEELLRGIYAYGFEKPSAIQQRAIMPCVKGHDVIAQAQSGKLIFRVEIVTSQNSVTVFSELNNCTCLLLSHCHI